MLAVLGGEAIARLLSGALRRRGSWAAVPFGALSIIAIERYMRRRFPRLMWWLFILRHLMRGGVVLAGSSWPAGKILERRLATAPERTLEVLARFVILVRATHLLHRTVWVLDLARTDLASLTIDSGRTGLLDGANFERATLTEVRLFGTMAGANLTAAVLDRVSFVGCFLRRASFRGARLQDVIVASGELGNCRFDSAHLSHCTFSDLDLSNSRFSEAALQHVIFERCDLSGSDWSGASCDSVDFIDCRRVPDGLDRAGSETGSASDAKPIAMGASPRSMARLTDSKLPDSVSIRFAQAGTQSTPPLGYRLQTLTRQMHLWIALGSGYHGARKEFLENSDPSLGFLFPRSRLLGALDILIGREHLGPGLTQGALVYPMLVQDLRDRHPELAAATFPELVMVDGDFPVANHLDLGVETYILMSMGLEVLSTRLARYCIAWSVPPAVSYMDRPADRSDPPAVREALLRELGEFAASGGDVSGLGRVQVSGLRDRQALNLAMTFERLVLAHELAHFLQAQGILPPVDSLIDREIQADVYAARIVAEDIDLDGDHEMIEAVQSIDVEDVRAILRFEGLSLKRRGIAVDQASEEELDPKSDAFVAGIIRFSDCAWHPSAVAAWIIIVAGSVGYHGDLTAEGRIKRVIGEAFGEAVLAEVMEEAARPGSVLWMLRGVFVEGLAYPR